jgi:ribose 5-phosphate isomerase B
MDLVAQLVESLQRRGNEVTLYGAATATTAAANDVHAAAARSVVEGRAETAVVCSWSGAGASIWASAQVQGARVAHCTDAETARVARRWANANVLALSLRLTSQVQMEEILDAWFATAANATSDDGISTDEALMSYLGRMGPGILDRIVGDLSNTPWLRDIVLTPLSRHDDVRGSNLQDTLIVFCRTGFSLRETAAILHIHPNTAAYRMKKIREVTGLEYRDIDDLLLLALAARSLGGPKWQTRLPWSAQHS